MAAEPTPLSATQIRYLKIGPKVNESALLKEQLIAAIEQEKQQEGADLSLGNGSLNKIAKFTYGGVSRTVNNFGVLINQNFGNQSTLHQQQKFGPLAANVDKIMQAEKDRPLEESKKDAESLGNRQDPRTFLKSIYNYQGEKLFVTLHSFSLEAKAENYKEVLPFSFLRLLVDHVGSSKLTRVIEGAFRFESEDIEISYEKVAEKAKSMSNSEQKYHPLGYKFEKLGAEFKINLPYVEFTHVESDFKSYQLPANEDIRSIVEEEFDNVHDIVYKYFDHQRFESILSAMKGQQEAENDREPEKPIEENTHQNRERVSSQQQEKPTPQQNQQNETEKGDANSKIEQNQKRDEKEELKNENLSQAEEANGAEEKNVQTTEQKPNESLNDQSAPAIEQKDMKQETQGEIDGQSSKQHKGAGENLPPVEENKEATIEAEAQPPTEQESEQKVQEAKESQAEEAK